MARKRVRTGKPQARRKGSRKATPPKRTRSRAIARRARPKAKAARVPRRAAKPAIKRSTGSPAGAGDSRRVPSLERERKRLREIEETVPTPPSSLNMDRHASAAATGRATIRQAKKQHTETSPEITGGDVDADWEDAYAVGDEAPGGDNPTPDQDRVDDIGRALGIQYQDNEELKGGDKVARRDKHRWELDPASAEDYTEHDKD